MGHFFGRGQRAFLVVGVLVGAAGSCTGDALDARSGSDNRPPSVGDEEGGAGAAPPSAGAPDLRCAEREVRQALFVLPFASISADPLTFSGVVGIRLLDEAQNPICDEQLTVTAALVDLTEETGCTEETCVSVCPFDDAGGQCIGGLRHIRGEDYNTDCDAFCDPTAWFSPEGDMLSFFEQFVISSFDPHTPAAIAPPGGDSFSTWGGYADAVQVELQTEGGELTLYPSAMLSFVNAQTEAEEAFTFSNEGFHYGVLMSNDVGLQNFRDNETAPRAAGPLRDPDFIGTFRLFTPYLINFADR
ncbi:MAG: hypothetical protein AAGA56_11400 [Myxococcota bacterium]